MPCWIEPIWTTKTCQSHAQNKCIISQSQACVLAAVYILFVSKSKHVASGVHHIKLPNSTNLIVHQMQTDKNTVSQKRTPLLFIIFTTTWAIWTNLIKFFHCWIPKETAEEGPPPPLKSVATQYDYCTLQWWSTIVTLLPLPLLLQLLFTWRTFPQIQVRPVPQSSLWGLVVRDFYRPSRHPPNSPKAQKG